MCYFLSKHKASGPSIQFAGCGQGGLTEFSNYAKLCTFCRIELHSSKSFFFYERYQPLTRAGGEHAH